MSKIIGKYLLQGVALAVLGLIFSSSGRFFASYVPFVGYHPTRSPITLWNMFLIVLIMVLFGVINSKLNSIIEKMDSNKNQNTGNVSEDDNA